MAGEVPGVMSERVIVFLDRDTVALSFFVGFYDHLSGQYDGNHVL